RRLATMEETLELFYYWFAVQRDVAVPPNMPKHRLIAILTGSDEEVKTRHLQWGSLPMVSDGFTPRRDNVVVMSAKVRLNDPTYFELDNLINKKIQDGNLKLEAAGISLVINREDLLSGKVYDNKGAGVQILPSLAIVQTAIVLAKKLE